MIVLVLGMGRVGLDQQMIVAQSDLNVVDQQGNCFHLLVIVHLVAAAAVVAAALETSFLS